MGDRVSFMLATVTFSGPLFPLFPSAISRLGRHGSHEQIIFFFKPHWCGIKCTTLSWHLSINCCVSEHYYWDYRLHSVRFLNLPPVVVNGSKTVNAIHDPSLPLPVGISGVWERRMTNIIDDTLRLLVGWRSGNFCIVIEKLVGTFDTRGVYCWRSH